MASSGIPLRIRLSLGSALRLSLAILAFGIIAYQTTRRTVLESTEGRARAVVFSMADRSSIGLGEVVRPLREAASDPAVVQALEEGSLSERALAVMARLPADSPQTVALGLRARTGQAAYSLRRPLPDWSQDPTRDSDSAGFSRAIVRGDSIYYEITAPVRKAGRLLGWVVRVRRVIATPAAVQTVRSLLGEQGGLLFGNADGTLWTDLTREVVGPADPATDRYRKNGREYLIASRAIAGTPYMFIVEFPVTSVLAPLRSLARDYAIIGGVLVLIGLAAGWWANARVTRPLTELTRAAETITARHRPGAPPNGSEEPAPRGDELVRLQSAFQTMADSVWQARSELEQQIQERTQAVKDLQVSEEALRLADRRKDDFLAMLAHELRNPLAPIRNAVHIFKVKNPADPDLQWSRDVIERQVGQMSRLLEDLLDVSRISHNRLELRLQRVDLRSVLASAIETSRPFIDGAGHELRVRIPPQPLELEADPVRLAQVFSNLLNNSAKYSIRPGEIRITASVRDSLLAVEVEDDGMGISAEAMPYIFDMFTQAAPGHDHSRSGLGIGLSLVKGLVGLHNGSVTVESPGPGRGSRFTVWLPLAPATAVPEPQPEVDHAGNGKGPGRRILIADDLEDSADSLATLLRMVGHEVRIAHDGEEAVLCAEQYRPDIALLDLGMPKMDGYEACRQIRAQAWGRDMTVIALTGWGQEDDRRRTGEAGFDHHLVKPVEPRVLLQIFDSLGSGV
jgi:signal transduction histidine kinase